jgi:hypothetical protein
LDNCCTHQLSNMIESINSKTASVSSTKESTTQYSAISNVAHTFTMSPTEGRWFIHSFESGAKPDPTSSDWEVKHTFVDNFLDYHVATIYHTPGEKPQLRNVEYTQKQTRPLTDQQIDCVKLLNVSIECYSDEIVLRELYKAYSTSVEELSIMFDRTFVYTGTPYIHNGDCERRRRIFDCIVSIQERRYNHDTDNTASIRHELLAVQNTFFEKAESAQKDNDVLRQEMFALKERSSAIEKENRDMKDTVNRLESKMATIMEFMLTMPLDSRR